MLFFVSIDFIVIGKLIFISPSLKKVSSECYVIESYEGSILKKIVWKFILISLKKELGLVVMKICICCFDS